MVNYTFVDLVGDEKTFFAEHFNVKPMLRERSIPGDAADILSLRKLDELVNLEVVRPPYIKVNLNGEGVPELGYTRNVVIQGVTITDIVDPERVYALYRAGATITWCSLNQIVPGVRDFTRIVSDKMAVRTDSVAFLTPPGKKGYPPHHDPVDLFIVQLEGTKHWKLWNPQAERLGTSTVYTDESLGEPAIETHLKPGDVLYLPYGTPHAAAAQAQASLHLSIMMRPRRWKDLLVQTFERLVEDAEFYDYPHIGELREADAETIFKEKIRSLATLLTDVEPAAELDRLADLGRNMAGSSSGQTFQSMRDLEGIGPSVRLRRTKARVEFGQNEKGRVELSVDGNKIAVPVPVAERLAALDADAFTVASEVFPGVDATRSTKAAQGLIRMGVLEVAPA